MKPLRVALVWAPYRLEYNTAAGLNLTGWWSYPTPEFEVYPYWLGKGYSLNVQQLARRGLDLIFVEDIALQGEFLERGDIPVIYHVVDSRLNAQWYGVRQKQARQADGILLDLDTTDRWEKLGKPLGRLACCVNDKVLHGGEAKTIDVNFTCRLEGQPERKELHEWLRAMCECKNWSYLGGWLNAEDYAAGLRQSKVVVNLVRGRIEGRNHRAFDAMACGAALLTTPLGDVPGEARQPGHHYLEWTDLEELSSKLTGLLEYRKWSKYGPRGRALMQAHHTWAIRSRELRQTLVEMFPPLERE